MQLPIDAREGPFKEKYIDEETPMFRRWMIFGGEKDGTVHVSDGTDDIVIGLIFSDARRLVAMREQFVDSAIWVLNGGLENVS